MNPDPYVEIQFLSGPADRKFPDLGPGGGMSAAAVRVRDSAERGEIAAGASGVRVGEQRGDEFDPGRVGERFQHARPRPFAVRPDRSPLSVRAWSSERDGMQSLGLSKSAAISPGFCGIPHPPERPVSIP